MTTFTTTAKNFMTFVSVVGHLDSALDLKSFELFLRRHNHDIAICSFSYKQPTNNAFVDLLIVYCVALVSIGL